MMCTYISCTAYFSVRAILILYHIKFLHGKYLRCLRMCVHGLEHQDVLARHPGLYASAPVDNMCGIRIWSTIF